MFDDQDLFDEVENQAENSTSTRTLNKTLEDVNDEVEWMFGVCTLFQ